MNDSILDTIKKMLGLEEDYEAFDQELIPLINSSLMTLRQIGIFKQSVYITSNAESWSSVLEKEHDVEGIKQYIYLQVRKIFDPPTSSSAMEAMNNMASELEWRLSIHAES